MLQLLLFSILQDLTHCDSFLLILKVYVREPPKQFVSMAEMMKKFQSSTRDLSLPHANGSHVNDSYFKFTLNCVHVLFYTYQIPFYIKFRVLSLSR